MITAVDTSVLLDVFTADPAFGPASRDTLGTCLAVGTVLVCSVVWAETSAFFPESDSAGAAMTTLGAAFNPLERRSADLAGEAWRSYRKRGGSRQRVIADFLIGAHASLQADRLLTRDRGFYRSYFPDLTVIEPTIG
ncbi:MAG: type II toxin-antitoxin system VapC family toxin [Actinomycetota bacterium]|nr:type II toxin-antitoxin system VapC family toxin [Actinomycetota bacterium]